MTKYSDMVYAKSHPSISMFSFCKCHKCVKHLNMKFVMLKLMQFILVGKAFNNNCIAKLCDGCFFCLYTHAELQQLIIATFCCLQNYFSKNGPTYLPDICAPHSVATNCMGYVDLFHLLTDLIVSLTLLHMLICLLGFSTDLSEHLFVCDHQPIIIFVYSEWKKNNVTGLTHVIPLQTGMTRNKVHVRTSHQFMCLRSSLPHIYESMLLA